MKMSDLDLEINGVAALENELPLTEEQVKLLDEMKTAEANKKKPA
jgi:hypothetical protein